MRIPAYLLRVFVSLLSLCHWLCNQSIQAQCEITIPNGYTLEISKANAEQSVLVHTVSQIRLVKISGGEYTIGTDQFADSMKVKVTLLPYWFGQSALSCVQVASILQQRFSTLPSEPSMDRVLRFGSLPILDGMDDAYDEYYNLFEVNRTRDPDFESIASKTLDAFENEYLKTLRKLGDAEFDLADFELAVELAAAIGCQLPTEAQWEVAAKQGTNNTPADSKKADSLFEWCSDFYSFDSFQMMAGSRDPAGPKYGKLTADQLKKGVESSTPPFRAAWLSRRLQVLRAVSDPERSFGSPASMLTGNSMHMRTGTTPRRGVRLAFVPDDSPKDKDTLKLKPRAE